MRQTAAAPDVRFRRPDEARPVRKSVRRSGVRLKQILALFAAAGAVFFAASRVIVFGLSWEKLEIRTVRVRAGDPVLAAAAGQKAGTLAWGNILVLDIASVRKAFESDPRIREARVRKSLPDAVEVEVVRRFPIAVLAKDPPVLVDADGVEIEPAPAGAEAVLPRFEDEDGFAQDVLDKVRLGWSCLRELAPGDRADVEALDLTSRGNVVLRLRSDPVRLNLGGTGFAAKLALFREKRLRWEREIGPLESLDLRFRDRIFVRTAAAKETR